MGDHDEQEAFFAYSGGKSLSPAEQEAFHAGWEAQADVDVAEHVLAAERERELVEALNQIATGRVTGAPKDCADSSTVMRDIAIKALAKIDATRD